MSESLVIHEIYSSIQGESTFAGLPCVFVRLTACNLRCSYCDTGYAFSGGSRMELPEVEARVRELAKPYRGQVVAEHKLPLVELTGGEPLLQKPVLPLMTRLCDLGFTVLIETSGAHDISSIDPRVHRIMDLKCPSSGEVDRNLWSNLEHLRQTDEIKFVIGTWEDLRWTSATIREYNLTARCPLLISWVHPLEPQQQNPSLKPVPPGQTPITRRELVEYIVREALPVRFQAQLHKLIWPPDQKGV